MAEESVAKKLTPTHLVPETPTDLEKAKEEIKKQTRAKDKEAPDLDDPRYQREWVFDFSYTDKRGKTWQGKFKNSILSLRQHREKGILRSQLSGGVPFDSLDPRTREQIFIVSHLSYSLAIEPRPDWAMDLESLDDYDLLAALYGEVAQHEAMFLGY